MEEQLQNVSAVGTHDSIPESHVQEIEEENETLKCALKDKDSLVDALNAQVMELQASVGSYQQELMDQDGGHVDEADYRAVLNENDALKGENITKSRRIDELNAMIQELELNAGGSQADEVNALRAENTSLRATVREKEGMAEALKSQVTTLEQDFAKYRQELKNSLVESDLDRAAMEQLKSEL